MKKKGIVYLVGAGPGDPNLITVRGKSLLQEADAVVYDALIDPSILRWAHPDAELHFVGKRSGSHSMHQEEINKLLVRLGRDGKSVVRLKGGDPFIFGRGGEEGMTLAAVSIPFEIVPGISSAIAAPAYAGIPVTHRGVAGNVAIITGHRFRDGSEYEHDWSALARMDTLVIVMGVGNMSRIVRRLLDAGKPSDTPAAVIQWGATSRQQVISGTLGEMGAKVAAAQLRPPAVTVIGPVAALRERIRWFDLPERRPLLGQRFLVTRTRAQAGQLSRLLAGQGAEPVEYPTICIVPQNAELLDAAIGRLESYTWILFTSANAVQIFWEHLQGLGKDTRALAGLKVGVIGPGTALALEQHGITPDFIPGSFVAESLAEEIGPVAGERILLPRAEQARPVLTGRLREEGAQVDEIKIYRAEPVLDSPPPLDVDWVTFTSSSTVRNFILALAKHGLTLPDGVKTACIGPITAQTARELGLPVSVVAEEYTMQGLISSIVETLQHEHEKSGSGKETGK